MRILALCPGIVIVALAHQLHLIVVAEGVESGPLKAALEAARCDAVQGFHIGPDNAIDCVQRLSRRLEQGARTF